MNIACKKGLPRRLEGASFSWLLLVYCGCLSPELVKGKFLPRGVGIIFYYLVTREWSLWADNVLSRAIRLSEIKEL